jgi:hypothetical protein
MNRKKFVGYLTACAGAIFPDPSIYKNHNTFNSLIKIPADGPARELSADLIICGGGIGGCAAALAALRNDLKVIMTEETKWIGGQISQQGVPPDEHQWIETYGATKTYRYFRNSIRDYYKKNYKLTDSARETKYFNPGDGLVSRLCHEPRVAVAVLNEMFAPFLASGKMVILTEYKLSAADITGHIVKSVTVSDIKNGKRKILSAPYFIDATELGDLLPLTRTAFITGSESIKNTRELHASDEAEPGNIQAFTSCFALDYLPGEDHTIDKPADYNFWVSYIPELKPPWPGRMISLRCSEPTTLRPKELAFNPEMENTGDQMNLWMYRRIINKMNFVPGSFVSDITLVNWPQNDFIAGNLIGSDKVDFAKLVDSSKQQGLSLIYWLQTEAPLPGKGYGWKGLRHRKDIMGTGDGFAMHPYIRESRRIKARFTILEEHVGRENRSNLNGPDQNIKAVQFPDSVGVGYYHIDLHPTCAGHNYIDIDSLPFQIPLGALIPENTENLIPACKNIGTTHITNGCYRLHPVEWNIGESAGSLIAFSLRRKVPPAGVYETKQLLSEFQTFIRNQGIETQWPG